MPDAMHLDLDFVRGHFPALSGEWTLMENAGGSVPLVGVIDAIRDYMSTCQVQLGASYELSAEATEKVRYGHQAMAEMVGAGDGEVILGPSTTMNLKILARALRPQWKAGDEIIVTNLDHETNIGPWRDLERSGMVIKEWRVRPETLFGGRPGTAGGGLELEDLDALLTDRTRLVAFTHCSNIVGGLVDAREVIRRVHAAGALACVDGVAHAPHRRVDVAALDADFYAFSLYKTYGPHLALLYGKRRHLLRARGQYHFFVGEDEIPYKFEPGNVCHELAASLPAIGAYFEALDAHHDPGAGGDLGARLDRVFGRVRAHEESLAAPVLACLRSKKNVRIVGSPTADGAVRVPTISFVVDGRKASEIPPLFEPDKIAIRWGDFYAARLIRDLGLLEQDGVVRISLVHYNTAEEVGRLVEILDRIL